LVAGIPLVVLCGLLQRVMWSSTVGCGFVVVRSVVCGVQDCEWAMWVNRDRKVEVLPRWR
jgi:hypothetical protein